MFTGLIEDCGTIANLTRTANEARLTVETSLPTHDLNMGDSVAVNGACLTVVDKGSKTFTVDMSPETFEKTTFSDMKTGGRVNLERAVRVGDRLGGHIVTGHVDTVATIQDVAKQQNAIIIKLAIDDEYARYIVPKGSVTIDGVSLTVNSVEGDSFSVSIIPHTLQATTLNDIRAGSRVNIETDILGKYLERLIGLSQDSGKSSKLTSDFLAKHGFM